MQWIAEVIKVSAFCQPIIPILFFSIPPPLNEMLIEEVFYLPLPEYKSSLELYLEIAMKQWTLGADFTSIFEYSWKWE